MVCYLQKLIWVVSLHKSPAAFGVPGHTLRHQQWQSVNPRSCKFRSKDCGTPGPQAWNSPGIGVHVRASGAGPMSLPTYEHPSPPSGLLVANGTLHGGATFPTSAGPGLMNLGAGMPLVIPQWVVVTTEGSMSRWGGHFLAQGCWSPEEEQWPINHLELRTAQLVFEMFFLLVHGEAARILWTVPAWWHCSQSPGSSEMILLLYWSELHLLALLAVHVAGQCTFRQIT